VSNWIENEFLDKKKKPLDSIFQPLVNSDNMSSNFFFQKEIGPSALIF
jgi:hypothetical protein